MRSSVIHQLLKGGAINVAVDKQISQFVDFVPMGFQNAARATIGFVYPPVTFLFR